MAENILELNDSNFEENTTKADLPVCVDFWAPWCGPCKMIAPIVAELAKEFAGKITVAKLDIAQNPEAAVRYGIKSIPALVFFKKGQVAGTIVGAAAKDKIRNQFLEVIGD